MIIHPAYIQKRQLKKWIFMCRIRTHRDACIDIALERKKVHNLNINCRIFDLSWVCEAIKFYYLLFAISINGCINFSIYLFSMFIELRKCKAKKLSFFQKAISFNLQIRISLRYKFNCNTKCYYCQYFNGWNQSVEKIDKRSRVNTKWEK